MTRKGRSLELALAPAALGLVLVAIVARVPPLMSALAVLWLLPEGLAAVLPALQMDERERAGRRAGERAGLTALLFSVCLLPLLLHLGGREPLTMLRREWADLGFLLLIPFWLRAAVFARASLSTRDSIQAVAGLGTLTALALAWGWAVAYPQRISISVALAATLVLVPHGVALSGRVAAAVLWLCGAAATAAWLLSPGYSPLELVLLLGLLVAPWVAAAMLAFRVHPLRGI